MVNRRRVALVAAVASLMALTSSAPGQAGSVSQAGLVSADPADNTPHVKDGKILAILPMGNRIYVAGTFTEVRNHGESTKLPRPGLFAFDPSTNRIDESFVPGDATGNYFGVVPGSTGADGEETGNPRGVHALAGSPDGKYIYAAGNWKSDQAGNINKKVVKLDAATGQRVGTFDSRITSAAKDIELSGSRLYVAGIFDSVGGTPRGGLAALDPTTGALLPDVNVAFTEPRTQYEAVDPGDPIDHDGDPNTPPITPPADFGSPRVEAIEVTPDGKTLVAGGNFTKAGGLERWQVALLDVTPGQNASVKSNWKTNRFDDRDPGDEDDPLHCASKFDSHIKDIDMSPDGSYFVVVTTGGYTSRGPLCDFASRWDIGATGSDIQPTWAASDGGDTMTGVEITGSAVYISGHMRWMNNFHNDGSAADATAGPGAVEREGIAALHPKSGLPLPWNPRRGRGHGAEALVATPQGLYVGSDTDYIGCGASACRQFDLLGSPSDPGELHEKLSFFPLAGGGAVENHVSHNLPGDLYSVSAAGLVRRPFDGSALGAALTLPSGFNWGDVRGAFVLGETLYTGFADGRLLRFPFTGNSIGAAAEVPMRGLQSESKAKFTKSDVGKITGMFYDNGRLYYTKTGDAKLHWRTFLPWSDPAHEIVGDTQYDVDSGRNWGSVAGITMAGGNLYFVENDTLHKMAWAGDKPSGSASSVGSAAGLGGRGLFVMPGLSAPGGPIDPPGGPIIQPGTVLRSGYWMVGNDGAVYAFGEARHLGDAIPHLGSALAVDLEPTPSSNGYWIIDDQGKVFGFGDARHHGNVDRSKLARDEKVTSLSATPSGGGYWIFTTKGRAIAFGDAGHHGDVSTVKLNAPVLDSIPTPSGKGYYMVAADGGIFTFGDAKFYGSTGDIRLNKPVQSLVPDPDGKGYWLVASDGGVFTFESVFRGSTGDIALNKPMTGMVPYGNGYLMVAEDGGIFNFSNLPFVGSLGDNPPSRPVVSVASVG
jgi:hypothetical protein